MPSKLTNPALTEAVAAVSELSDLMGVATALDQLVGELLLLQPVAVRNAAQHIIEREYQR